MGRSDDYANALKLLDQIRPIYGAANIRVVLKDARRVFVVHQEPNTVFRDRPTEFRGCPVEYRVRKVPKITD